MNRIHKNLERKDFETHSPIVEQHAYCTATGLLASDSCPSKAMGWYSKNNMPGYCVSCTAAAPAEPATNAAGGEATTAAQAEGTTAAPATTAAATEANTAAPAA